LPIVVTHSSYRHAVAIISGVCVLSLVSAVAYAFLEKFKPKQTNQYTQLATDTDKDTEATVHKDGEALVHKTPLTATAEISTTATQPTSLTQRVLDAFSWVKKLNFSYLCVLMLALVNVGTIYTFISFGTTVLTKSGYNAESASQITSLSSLVYAVCTPVFGVLVGWMSRFKVYFSILGATLLLLVYFMFALTDWYPLIFIALGAVQAFGDVVAFSSVGLVVDHSIIGKATGLIFLCDNLALFVLPLIIGALYDNGMPAGVYILFVACAALQLVFAILWKLFGNINLSDHTTNQPR